MNTLLKQSREADKGDSQDILCILPSLYSKESFYYKNRRKTTMNKPILDVKDIP